ncbi:sigma-70 family RNA polymerase sigma factor [Sulfobacillus thermosulfidooxidans]|uniref:sigma-70 family RNA polymerase sigma factor n=1 Tax=Sulfobacillus thermosulfidooxidans TaxID=28034 RepID=UPI0002E3B2EA|nr:sigma-70 family RNA polymerase sigma factor [Sulfobacillus thermosulfidooxidans]
MARNPHKSVLSDLDERLWVQAAQKDSDGAFPALLQHYTPRLRRWIRPFFVRAQDPEDLAQIARIAFWQAVMSYRPDNPGAPAFSRWARMHVQRRIYDAMTYTQRRKRADTLIARSLDAVVWADPRSSVVLGDRVTADGADPVDRLLATEALHAWTEQLAAVLTDLEWEVLWDVVLTGSLSRSAQRLRMPVKRVDNALQRARDKARRLRAEGDFAG